MTTMVEVMLPSRTSASGFRKVLVPAPPVEALTVVQDLRRELAAANERLAAVEATATALADEMEKMTVRQVALERAGKK